MDHVVTLIGDPAASRLTPDLADAAVRALTQAGASAGGPDWLAPGIACDIPFQATAPGETCGALDDLLRAALGGAPVDIAIQDARMAGPLNPGAATLQWFP